MAKIFGFSAAANWLRNPPEKRAFAAAVAAERDQARADNARLERELAELRRRLAEKGGFEQTPE